MAFDLGKMIRGSAARRSDRPQLLIPAINEISSIYCEELVSKQLANCAKIIKDRGGLFRWRKYNAKPVLVIWAEDSKVFINFDNPGFCQWLGSNFDLCDRMGIHFGLPAAGVAARIWETLLLDSSGLDYVSWSTVDERRRANK